MNPKEKQCFVFCESRNGGYCFPEKNDELPEKQKDYCYVDLSTCETLEEMAAVIMDEEIKNLLLVGTEKVQNVLTALAGLVNQIDESINVSLQIYKDTSKESEEDAILAKAKTALHNAVTGNYEKTQAYERPDTLLATKEWFIYHTDKCNKMNINSIFFLTESDYDQEVVERWRRDQFISLGIIGTDSIYINDRKNQIPWKLVDFVHRASIGQMETGTYIRLESKEDYEKLYEELALFSETGKIRNPFFYLVDECRWTGSCTLQFQRRGKVTGENTVSICGSKHVYNFEQEPYRQFEKREQVMEQTEKRRGCAHCAVSAWCSKCSGLDDEQERKFCETMQNYLEILDYIKIKNAILKMDLGNQDISFAHYKHTLVLPEKARGRKPLTHEILLGRSPDGYVALCQKEKRTKELSRGQAFVLEAQLKGYHKEAANMLFEESGIVGEFEELWIQMNQMLETGIKLKADVDSTM